jgi:uncharacterized protein DUF3606
MSPRCDASHWFAASRHAAQELPAVIREMKIDVNRNDDIEHWARHFGITRAQLIAAIAAAGPRVEDVEARILRERAEVRENHRLHARRRAFHAYD